MNTNWGTNGWLSSAPFALYMYRWIFCIRAPNWWGIFKLRPNNSFICCLTNAAVLSFILCLRKPRLLDALAVARLDTCMMTKIQIWRDINDEILCMVNRFKDLAVHCVISIDGFSRPCYVHDLTFGRIELHVPQLFTLLEFIQVILKGSRIFLSLNCQVHRSIVRRWTREWIWSDRSLM